MGEEPPDNPVLARLRQSIHLRSTRLDVVYQARMEALARVRAQRTVVLEELLGRLGPLLPALAEPLSLLEVAGAGRGSLIHLRALLVLGQRPPFRASAIAGDQKPEGLFLVDGRLFSARASPDGAGTWTCHGLSGRSTDWNASRRVMHFASTP